MSKLIVAKGFRADPTLPDPTNFFSSLPRPSPLSRTFPTFSSLPDLAPPPSPDPTAAADWSTRGGRTKKLVHGQCLFRDNMGFKFFRDDPDESEGRGGGGGEGEGRGRGKKHLTLGGVGVSRIGSVQIEFGLCVFLLQ
jgi:hypothetical protein